jgi:aspartyl-tRNA(Asn)/glutamyl-tRNA(Gln) amidotransferase subunit B
MGEWQPVIGLEIHVQLATTSKIFSAVPAHSEGEPNTHVDPVTLGMPGVLPVLNRHAVELAIRVGLSLGCQINQASRFDRKHYFYPDLPKGYQITQQHAPICLGGTVDTTVDGEARSFQLNRIHMEEDAGKTIHDSRRGISLVDYNRAGVPLIEVVSEPVMHTADEAVAFMKALHQIVVAVGSSDGNMEKGNFRCDANVSVRPDGSDKLGTRTEIKNINSFRFVKRALEYEIARQIETVESGDRVVQETRLWDDESGVTRSMRSKEDAHDYRYFPDPDLMVIHVDDAWLNRIRDGLPELPRERRSRYIAELGLSEYDADVMTQTSARADFFESVLGPNMDPKQVANWVQGELLGRLNKDGKDIEDSPVNPDELAALLKTLTSGTLSGKMAKACFAEMYDQGVAVAEWVAKNGGQITDEEQINSVVERILDANPNQVSEYLSGKEKLLGFFVGQVMKETRGKANPGVVNQLARQLLKERG